jgi:hypothetical protein
MRRKYPGQRSDMAVQPGAHRDGLTSKTWGIDERCRGFRRHDRNDERVDVTKKSFPDLRLRDRWFNGF